MSLICCSHFMSLFFRFHRIKNRQERRQKIKETEELLLRDPEAAKEKLEELDKDRAFERATLKHRGVNKWSKTMKQFAAKNPEMKKLLDEHHRVGREMKSHHNLEGISDDDDDEFSESSDEEAEKQKKPKVYTVGEIISVSLFKFKTIH